MPDIIESDEGKSSIVIGVDEAPVSLKVYQDIYHQVTGRTEQIRKRYSDNLLIDFEEIEQLNFKIMQLCDVHEIVANSATVSIFHDNERKEQFTSFERFKLYNSNSSKPTINIVLKYNFSIIPPGLKKPQEYVITIMLVSRIAAIQNMENEAPPLLRHIMLNLSSRTVAEISVEYSDYIIARSFLESFKEWVKGCNSVPDNKIMDSIQSYSFLIPKFLQVIFAILFIYFTISSIPSNFQLPTSHITLARFIGIYGGVFYIVIVLMEGIGNFIEYGIASVSQISYLKLNKGDEKLIKNYGKRKIGIISKLILGGIGTIILGIISSKLSLLV